MADQKVHYTQITKVFREKVPQLKDATDPEILEILKKASPKLVEKLDTSDSLLSKIADIGPSLQRGAMSGLQNLISSGSGLLSMVRDFGNLPEKYLPETAARAVKGTFPALLAAGAIPESAPASIKELAGAVPVPKPALQKNLVSGVAEATGALPAQLVKYAAGAAITRNPMAAMALGGAASGYEHGPGTALLEAGKGAAFGKIMDFAGGLPGLAAPAASAAAGAIMNPDDPILGALFGGTMTAISKRGKAKAEEPPPVTPPALPDILAKAQENYSPGRTWSMGAFKKDQPLEVRPEIVNPEKTVPPPIPTTDVMLQPPGRPIGFSGTAPLSYNVPGASGKPPAQIAESPDAWKREAGPDLLAFMNREQSPAPPTPVQQTIDASTGVSKPAAPRPVMLFFGDTQPKRAKESAQVFSPETFRSNQKQRRESIEPPVTGIPEATARYADALDRIAMELGGKKFTKLNKVERATVRELADSGYIGNPESGNKQGFSFGSAGEQPGTVLPSMLGGLQQFFSNPNIRQKLPNTPGQQQLRSISDRWHADAEAARPGIVHKLRNFSRTAISGLVDPLDQPLRIVKGLEDKAGLTETVRTVSGDFRASKERTLLPSDKIPRAYDKSKMSRAVADEAWRSSGIPDIIFELGKGYGYFDRVARTKDFSAYLMAKQMKDVEIRKLGEAATGYSAADKPGKINEIRQAGELLYSQQAASNQIGQYTGKPLHEIDTVIREGAGAFEPLSQRYVSELRNFKQMAVDSGILSREKSDYLDKIYPQYVPLARIVEESGPMVKVGSPANLSKQGSFVRLKGSQAEIEPPLVSARSKVDQIVSEVNRNNAAKELVNGFSSLPGGDAFVKPATPATKGSQKITYYENGIPLEFEADPLLAMAAKTLTPSTSGAFTRIAQFTSRMLQASATALNTDFATRNIGKDTQAAGIVGPSLKAVFDPKVFVESVGDAVTHGKGWREMRAQGGGFNQYIGYRDTPQSSLELDVALASGTAAGKASGVLAYYGTHPLKAPGALLHTMESLTGKSEDLTRLRGYKASKKEYMDMGYSEEDAKVRAINDANNEYGPNYLRKGAWVDALMTAFPYLNARVQGTKQRVERGISNPISTAVRYTALLAFPKAVFTIWNLSSDERRKAYEDVRDHVKDTALFLLPDSPEKDPDTKHWNGFRIPTPDGFGQLSGAIESALVEYQKKDPEGFQLLADRLFSLDPSPSAPEPVAVPSPDPVKTAGKLAGMVMPFDLTAEAIGNEALPQAAKVVVEERTGKNWFTGQPARTDAEIAINQPRFEVTPRTSAVLEKVANAMGKSPKELQFQIGSPFGHGGAFLHGLNLVDHIANTLGVVDRVGGVSPLQSMKLSATIPGGEEKVNAAKINQSAKQESTDQMVDALGDTLYRYAKQNGVNIGPVGRKDGESDEEYILRGRLRGLALHRVLSQVLPQIEASEDKEARKLALQKAVSAANTLANRVTSRRGWDKLDKQTRLDIINGQIAAIQ